MNQKLTALRALFKSHNISGYIIPSYDEYQNEYVPSSSKRLQFITGFTGSNGITIITSDKAYFFTDKRYLLQSKKELSSDFEIRDLSELFDFNVDGVLGYNPKLFTEQQLKFWFKNLKLESIEKDLVDAIWENKPATPASEVYEYPLEYAGLDTKAKLQIIRKEFANKADYLLITSPDNICWLLNIRASDIEFSPIMLGYALVSQTEVMVFTQLSRLPQEIRRSLNFVTFYDEGKIYEYLSALTNKVMFDPEVCSVGLQKIIKNKLAAPNPCVIAQSCKNEAEIAHAKSGHIKDAVALCEALAWVTKNRATEYEFSLKLSYFRSIQAGYVMDSFPPIIGFKDNGAVIHYRPNKTDSKMIEGDGMLLIDSGGHYYGCTTDVTRNIIFGKASDELRIRYMHVLKGHLRLAMQRFPVGTFGCNLDVLARMHLWNEGLDYGHGTGHGVGNFLNVHEKPASIRQNKAEFPLKEGMIVSNEPGFYKDGEYGIRIENLMYIKKSGTGFLEFEMLTLVPYCKDLIDIKMLDKAEYEYLLSYCNKIREVVLPMLSESGAKWLESELDLK